MVTTSWGCQALQQHGDLCKTSRQRPGLTHVDGVTPLPEGVFMVTLLALEQQAMLAT